MSRELRVFIAHPQRIFVEALHRALATTPGVIVAGSATLGSDAEKQISRLRPDVVVLDDQLWTTRRFPELVERLRHADPRCRVIALVDDDEALVAYAPGRGIDSIVLEQPSFNDLVAAIRGERVRSSHRGT